MRIPEPDEVLGLAEDLREARDRVAKLEKEWAALFVPATPITSQPLRAKIVAFLNAHANDSFSVATLSSQLDANENSVGPYLSMLVGEGKIERRDRGMYGAVSDKAPKRSDSIGGSEAFESPTVV